jgi:hypothetical protein
LPHHQYQLFQQLSVKIVCVHEKHAVLITIDAEVIKFIIICNDAKLILHRRLDHIETDLHFGMVWWEQETVFLAIRLRLSLLSIGLRESRRVAGVAQSGSDRHLIQVVVRQFQSCRKEL